MTEIINKISDLKKQRNYLKKEFEKAMKDKDVSVAISVKIKQDEVSEEIMKCYDRMIDLQEKNTK